LTDAFQQLQGLVGQADHRAVLELAGSLLAKHPSDPDLLKCLAVASIKLEAGLPQALLRLQQAKVPADPTLDFLTHYLLYLTGQPVPESKDGLSRLVYAQHCFRERAYRECFEAFYEYVRVQTDFKKIPPESEAIITEAIVNCLGAYAAAGLQDPRIDNLARLMKSYHTPLNEWFINLSMIQGPEPLNSLTGTDIMAEDQFVIEYLRHYYAYRQHRLCLEDF
jgi:hypothetical protein